jgi:glyoxylase-like metal-dependent hydrolase (beta-lactamase superfamily II)
VTSKLETARRWFDISRVDDGVSRIVEPYADALIRCNIWHIRGRDNDLLVDTGLGVAPLRNALRQFADREPWALATHAHFDHVGGMHEFETRIAHPLEAPLLTAPGFASLRVDDYPRLFRAMFPGAADGQELVTAYPFDRFDPSAYRIQAAPATRLVGEGDVIDLGARTLEVLHLPGHTIGSIGLWEAATGVLFSGDTVYDGELLDELPDSDQAAYLRTMERLQGLPATVVHAGHGESFGHARFTELIDGYLAGRRK